VGKVSVSSIIEVMRPIQLGSFILNRICVAECNRNQLKKSVVSCLFSTGYELDKGFISGILVIVVEGIGDKKLAL